MHDVRPQPHPVASKKPADDPLVEFAKWCIRTACWEAVGLDGGDVQEKAEELGLLERHEVTKEDVEAGLFYPCEPGDIGYIFSGPLEPSS